MYALRIRAYYIVPQAHTFTLTHTHTLSHTAMMCILEDERMCLKCECGNQESLMQSRDALTTPAHKHSATQSTSATAAAANMMTCWWQGRRNECHRHLTHIHSYTRKHFSLMFAGREGETCDEKRRSETQKQPENPASHVHEQTGSHSSSSSSSLAPGNERSEKQEEDDDHRVKMRRHQASAHTHIYSVLRIMSGITADF